MVVEWWVLIFSRQSFLGVSYTCSCDCSVYDGRKRCTYTHLLHAHFSAHGACTVTFAYFSCVSHTRMAQAQVVVKKVFVARVSYLSILLSPSHVSPILAVHWRSLRDHSWLDVRTFLPCLLVLEAQGMRTSARAARSLAIWPSPPSTQVMSPRSSTKSLLWTVTRCSLAIQTSMKSLTPRKTHTREHWTVRCSHNVWTLRFARFSRWFCSSNRKRRKHASGNRLLHRERKEREGSVIRVVKSMSKKKSTEQC